MRRRGELPEYAAPEFPGQIPEAACLAHDIGNPPFGHAGEFAIRDWFGDPANHTYMNALEETHQSDFRCFDGNAQGFRVVNVVENNRDQGGFRLTYPTLASMVKYPWDSWQSCTRSGKCKFNYYQAEAGIFEEVFCALGLKTAGATLPAIRFSLLAEAADDTCYRIVDMEDARELDIITLADILKVVEPLAPSLKLDPQRLEDMGSDRERAGYVRARVIGHVTASLFETFAAQYERIMRREFEGPLMDMAPEDVRAYMDRAKEIFNGRILKNSHKTALEIGSYSVYKRLLDTFIPACHRRICDPGRLTYKEQQALQLMGGHAPRREDDLYVSYLRVLDFITGMTDQYASSCPPSSWARPASGGIFTGAKGPSRRAGTRWPALPVSCRCALKRALFYQGCQPGRTFPGRWRVREPAASRPGGAGEADRLRTGKACGSGGKARPARCPPSPSGRPWHGGASRPRTSGRTLPGRRHPPHAAGSPA